ncbi:MAG TPA: aminotransferase class IV, partial [Aquaticitalea sp.]|nr:aminotransferase class IV [Aquaticitalea sp.]
ILKTIVANQLMQSSSRVRLNVHRDGAGKYLPETGTIAYSIIVEKLDTDFYVFPETDCTIDIYKDFLVNPGLLSTLKTNNRIVNVLGSVYAKENLLDTCLLLNNNKNVVEALHANIFMVNGNTIVTPPLADGCIKGVLRKQIIEIVDKSDAFEIVEASISPFELQKADELFLTNVIIGIHPIKSYRKKTYAHDVSRTLLGRLNAKIRLG